MKLPEKAMDRFKEPLYFIFLKFKLIKGWRFLFDIHLYDFFFWLVINKLPSQSWIFYFCFGMNWIHERGKPVGCWRR